MIKCGDILDLRVEKLTYHGWGLAKFCGHSSYETTSSVTLAALLSQAVGELTSESGGVDNQTQEQCNLLPTPPHGFAVFIKNACPGDLLKVRIEKCNKNYAHAKILEIIEESEHRIKPFCPLFNACGSCHWQFVEYNFALEQKRLIIQEALRHCGQKSYVLTSSGVLAASLIGCRRRTYLRKDTVDKATQELCKPLSTVSRGDYNVLPVLASPKTKEYRCKIQCPAGQTKVSKRLLIGYFKEGTHDVTDIKYCPVQPRGIDEILNYIRQNWTLGVYSEKSHKGLLRHVAIRSSSSGKGTLLTFVLNASELRKKERETLEKFVKEIPKITGCALSYNPQKTNAVLGEKFEHIHGEEFIFEKLKSRIGANADSEKIFTYKISAQSFFQINPQGAAVLFDEVKKRVKPNSSVLDAYGGVGAIGIWVSDVAKNIVLVEENEQATKNAKENFKLNECKNYEVFLGDAKEKFKQFAREGRKFDHVILDPPRKGCEREVLEILSKITDSIIYVSCNPQTLARDIKILEEKNFKCGDIQGVDMFAHTYHIECVTVLERNLPTEADFKAVHPK